MRRANATALEGKLSFFKLFFLWFTRLHRSNFLMFFDFSPFEVSTMQLQVSTLTSLHRHGTFFALTHALMLCIGN